MKPLIRFIKFRILHVDDSPRNLAMGVALGLFVAWTPTIGIQMLISIALAVPFKANKFLAAAMAWVSNIFTLIPVYLPSYIVGKWVLELCGSEKFSSNEHAIELLKRLSSFHFFVDMWTLNFWKEGAKVMLEIGLPLWIGSVIVGLLLAVVSYFCTYKFIVWYRLKNPHILLRFKRRTQAIANRKQKQAGN